jgi:hypothetical protein
MVIFHVYLPNLTACSGSAIQIQLSGNSPLRDRLRREMQFVVF